MRGVYRHSVWIEIFGIVLFGLVLLGGAGYLLSELAGSASGLGGGGGGAIASGGPAARGPAPTGGRGPAGRPSRVPGLSNPLSGGGPTGGSAPGTEAPFSNGWQNQATPDLTGPSGSGGLGSGGVPAGGGAVGEGAPASEGPTIALRRSPSGGESGAGRTSIRPENSGWRAEAQNWSGRARALSNQLGQMQRRQGRSAPEQTGESSPTDADAKTSSGQGSASTSNPGTPDAPNEVPIGGLEWLAAVGLLHGLRRLGFAGEP